MVDIAVVEKTAIVIADTTDYAGDLGTRTDQIDLTSLANSAYRQATKIDLAYSGALLANWYDVYAAIEFAVAPASGELLAVYIGFSPSSTAGTANPGGTSGADSAYTGPTNDVADDAIHQLDEIGRLVAVSEATTFVQFQYIGRFEAKERYANIVVRNESGQALVADAVEMAIRIVPKVVQSQ